MWKTKTVAFLFLSFTGFMILKPIKNILAFNLSVVAKLCSDVFDLLGIGSPHSSTIKHLQYPNLFLSWIPPCPSWVRFHPCLYRPRVFFFLDIGSIFVIKRVVVD